MSCAQNRPRLGELLVGALNDELAAPLLEHLAECDACGAELAELQALEDDLALAAAPRAASAPTPANAPTRWAPRRRRAWRLVLGPALAASLLAVALVGRPSAEGAGEPLPASALARGPGDVPLRRPLRFAERTSLALPDGSVVAADAGALLELTGPRSLVLHAGLAAFDVAKHRTPFTVRTPRGAATVLGTTFRLEVKEIDMHTAARASAAVTVVTLAVASGVVLFVPDGGEPMRVEAGQAVVAGPDGVDLLDAAVGSKAPATAPAEVEALRAEKAELEAENQALAARLEALEARLEGPRPAEPVAPAGESASPPAERALAVDYGRWSERDVLRDADWKKMGGAFKTMIETMPELYAVLKAGEKPSTELAVKFSRENTKLLEFAIEVMGKLPTSVESTGNGPFTHPIVTSNLLVEHMRLAGEPLSESQLAFLQQLGAQYDADWDALQAGYDQGTHTLRIVDELQLKLSFYEGMTGLLTPTQRQLVIDPEFQHVSGIDMYSPVLMLTGVAQPLDASSLEALKASLIDVATGWGFGEADLQAQGIVFDAWITDLGELTLAPAAAAPLFEVGQALRAARAQLGAMQELEVRLAPGADTRQALRAVATFSVPRLLAQ